MNEDMRFCIPDNLTDKRKFFGIPNRNLIETAIIEIILFLILRVLPFVTGFKIVLGVIFMLPAGIIAIIGIKNESLTEFLISTILFNRNKRVMHFRNPEQSLSEDFKAKPDQESAKKKNILDKLIDMITPGGNFDEEQSAEEEYKDKETEEE